MNHRWALAGAALVAGLAAFAGTAGADCCDAQCAEAAGCLGECSLCLPAPCGVLCVGTCSLRCRGIGPAQQGCTEGGDFDGENIPPSTEDTRVARPWAVLQVTTDGSRSPRPDDVRAVAYSSSSFGDYAAARWLEKAASEARSPAERPPAVEEHSYNFLYLGRVGGTVGIEAVLLEHGSPREVPVGSGIYFRALTDGTGSIADLQVLFARYADHARVFADFVRDNLYVSSASTVDAPVELFGFVVAVGEDREPGHMIIGAREVAADVRSLSDLRPAPAIDWTARLASPCRETSARAALR